MSESVSRADKLAIAKRKLKEFEARRQRESDTSPAPSVASTAEHNVNNGRSSVNSNHSHNAHENRMFSPSLNESGATEQLYQQQPYVISITEDSATNSSPALSTSNNLVKNLVMDASASNTSSPIPQHSNTNGVQNNMISHNSFGQQHSSNADRAQLQHERDAAVAAYEQVSGQLEQLRMHYTQLHAAYSSMSNNAVYSDADKQIQQLQSALAVLVEEKTSVQSELRNVKNDLEQERILNESLSANMKSLRGDESKKVQARLVECEHLLSARSLELDGLRRSEANAQAQLLAVQHERSEAQARLKVVAREKEVLESELKQVRKELHMKEIYLKQLGPHGIVNNMSDENTIKALHDRIDALQTQVGLLTNERDQLHHNSQELGRHYEICRLEFVTSRDKIANELAQATSERDAALQRVMELENDVSVLQKELNQSRSVASSVNTGMQDSNAISFTEEDVMYKINEAKRRADAEWQQKFDEEGKVVDAMLRNKDQLIFEREQTISELQVRLRLLEERSAETRASGSDLLSLSEQLQNEKATVSRAVAQNRELKEQLLETEDRLVALTEEKLHSELARQTAEHQVKELLKRIDTEGSHSDSGSVQLAGASDALEAVLHPATSIEPSRSVEDWDETERDRSESCADVSREREQMLETQLEMANQQLEEIRADLRRSHTRNEEMNQILRQNAEDENQNSIHVELGQAVARIHELAAENQQLRENVEQLRHERSQLEVSMVDKSNDLNGVTQDFKLAANGQSLDASHDQNSLTDKSTHVGSEEWARSELEKRFAQAMFSNAELRETLDSLEHINLQLQLENDTIADHVILYQHQRRLIRERLRAKDEQLAAMEADRRRTLERCKELQKALMDVLARTGALKEYEVRDRSHLKHVKQPKRKVARSYSHSTVDEFSGDEDVIVNGSDIEVPPRTSVDSADENVLSEEGRSESVEPVEVSGPAIMQKTQHSVMSNSVPETDAAVRRILEIITDISKPPHPSAVDNLHCTQCIGEIQML
ncbi:GOLGi associated coiled-coil protein [Trichostrongylus colubriformis]|uniref:GOLGi associated coiled-coil protein n=1 Tax=Trichostrongylus colubriformis TaxID=6319 RepID=A0AAN8EZ30_TRICO